MIWSSRLPSKMGCCGTCRRMATGVFRLSARRARASGELEWRGGSAILFSCRRRSSSRRAQRRIDLRGFEMKSWCPGNAAPGCDVRIASAFAGETVPSRVWSRRSCRLGGDVVGERLVRERARVADESASQGGGGRAGENDSHGSSAKERAKRAILMAVCHADYLS